MGLFNRLFGTSDREQKDEQSCNVSGHHFEDYRGPKYYARGVAHFGLRNSFTIKKKVPEKCTKCGKYREQESTIGKVKVNKDTDELVVVQ